MSKIVSQLSFKIAKRPYVKMNGAHKSGRTYIDFCVDGHSIGEQLSALGFDLVTHLTTEFVKAERVKAAHRLLLIDPPDCPDGRSTLYVCAECGDLGCGAVSIIAEQIESTIAWRNFDYENNYEPRSNDGSLAKFGPFEFDESQYRETIRLALETIDKQS